MADDSSFTLEMSSDVWEADWEGATTSVARGHGDPYDVVTVQVRRRPDAPRPQPPEGFDRVVSNGRDTVTLKHASTGGTLFVLEVHVTRWCAVAADGRRKRVREEVPLGDGGARRTLNFARDVGRHMEGYGLTVRRCAETCHTTPQIVKEIDLARLRGKYGEMRPSHLSRYLAIDESEIAKPRRYCTVVVDAESGELLYLEKGKGKRQALHFFEWVGDEFMSHVEAVSMDMNCDFSAAFRERYPGIAIVWDGFHLLQWYNDKTVNSLRRSEANRLRKESRRLGSEAARLAGEAAEARESGEDGADARADALEAEAASMLDAAESVEEERRLLFGERFNLLANRRTVRAKDALNAELNREAREQAEADGRDPSKVGHRRTDNEEGLRAVLDANDKLNTALRAREELQDALALDDPDEMRARLEAWVATWSKAGITQLTWFTKTVARRMDGIVARAEHRISSGIIEGTNTLIKNVRRQAFGMGDFDYFGYRLYEITHLPNRRRERIGGKVPRTYVRKRKRNVRRAKVTIFKTRKDEAA